MRFTIKKGYKMFENTEFYPGILSRCDDCFGVFN